MILILCKDEATASDIQITVKNEGVEFYCYSIFDKNSWESDTYISKPFSILGFKKLLDDLKACGKGTVSENDQTLSFENSGKEYYDVKFDGGINNNCFIPHILINLEELCNKFNASYERKEF